MPLSSCNNRTSGFCDISQFVTCSKRALIEFTFQLAITMVVLFLSGGRCSEISTILIQQFQHDGRPFGTEISRLCRAAGAPVPIAGIAGVAFGPVQIGVYPGSLASLLGLGDLMCLFPLSSPSEPQGTKRGLIEWFPANGRNPELRANISTLRGNLPSPTLGQAGYRKMLRGQPRAGRSATSLLPRLRFASPPLNLKLRSCEAKRWPPIVSAATRPPGETSPPGAQPRAGKRSPPPQRPSESTWPTGRRHSRTRA